MIRQRLLGYPRVGSRSALRPAPLYRQISVFDPSGISPSYTMGVTIRRDKGWVKEGVKTFPKPGDTVQIHYTGRLTNGVVFDRSKDHTPKGEPWEVEIGVGKVIRGWDEAIPQLSVGEEATLIITSDYAYGERGVPSLIPPNATLEFEVNLVGIIPKK